MASFHQVQLLQTVQSEYESGCKAILQLKIAGASEVIVLLTFKYSIMIIEIDIQSCVPVGNGQILTKLYFFLI